MKRVFKSTISFLAIVIITGIGLEIVTGAYYRWMNGSFIWATPPGSAALVTPEERDESRRPRLQLHPYFGFVYRPGLAIAEILDMAAYQKSMGYTERPYWWHFFFNNHGFLSDRDYPYQKANSNELIVGIFGSSVATNFAIEGSTRLIEAVKKVPGYADRDVVVLSFSVGQTHQPAPLLTLNYMLSIGQKFDLVINMDGSNEPILGYQTADTFAKDVSMPNPLVIYGAQNAFLSRDNAVSRAVLAERARMRIFEQGMATSRSAVAYYVRKALWSRHVQESVQIEADVSGPKTGLDYPIHLVARKPSDSPVDKELVDNWLRSIVQMNLVASHAGAAFIEVLHPSQYYGGRSFSADERRVAFADPPTASAQQIPIVYDGMRQKASLLKDKGIAFVDASGAFDQYQEQFYYDSCCHFNRRGNEVIVDDLLAGPISEALTSIKTRNK